MAKEKARMHVYSLHLDGKELARLYAETKTSAIKKLIRHIKVVKER